MAMSFRLIAPAALLLLGACDTVYPNGSIDPGFGEAVKYSTAVQVIDPDPVYTAEGARPGDSGEKGAEASKRHRTGTVKDVQVQSTSSGGSGGGGGG
jgi:hypothetical protein